MSANSTPKTLTKGGIKAMFDTQGKGKQTGQDIVLQCVAVKDLLVNKPNGNMKYK